MIYNALIVDDEQINIEILKKIISDNFFQIQIIGTATCLDEANSLLANISPHILFLDINLKGELVFDMLDKILVDAEIIFVSSDIGYAFKAFRYDAVDFVSKPVEVEIMVSAIQKALNKIEYKSHMEYNLVDKFKSDFFEYYKENFLTISTLEKQEIFKFKDVMFLMAEGRCTTFFLSDGRQVLSTRNLTEFELLFKRLPFFIKINRQYIINFEYVKRIVKKGGPFFEFKGGALVPISRKKLTELNKLILPRTTLNSA